MGSAGAFTLYLVVLLMFGVSRGMMSGARLAPAPRRLAVLGSVVARLRDRVPSPRARRPGEPTDPHASAAVPAAGWRCCVVASEWPLHDLAERYLYSVHMVQHLLFTLVAAPLLVAGIAGVAVGARCLRPRPSGPRCGSLDPAARGARRCSTRVLLFTHWPAVVDASVGSELAHFALHALLIWAAYLMWWPIDVAAARAAAAPARPAQMLYLFLQSLAPTIPASFLTFGHQPLYPVYADVPADLGHRRRSRTS